MPRQQSEVLYMSHGASAQCTFEYNKKAIAREPQNQILTHRATSNETLYLCGFENDSVHWCLTTVTRMK